VNSVKEALAIGSSKQNHTSFVCGKCGILARLWRFRSSSADLSPGPIAGSRVLIQNGQSVAGIRARRGFTISTKLKDSLCVGIASSCNGIVRIGGTNHVFQEGSVAKNGNGKGGLPTKPAKVENLESAFAIWPMWSTSTTTTPKVHPAFVRGDECDMALTRIGLPVGR